MADLYASTAERIHELRGHEITYREACEMADALRVGLGELHVWLDGELGDLPAGVAFRMARSLGVTVERLVCE